MIVDKTMIELKHYSIFEVPAYEIQEAAMGEVSMMFTISVFHQLGSFLEGCGRTIDIPENEEFDIDLDKSCLPSMLHLLRGNDPHINIYVDSDDFDDAHIDVSFKFGYDHLCSKAVILAVFANLELLCGYQPDVEFLY
jgi:hypothetical protein